MVIGFPSARPAVALAADCEYFTSHAKPADRQGVIRRLVFPFALLLFAALRFAGAAPQRPGREISMPRSEVKDTFLAYVLGIIHAGIEVELDNEFLRGILSEFKTTIGLPFEEVRLVSQLRVPESENNTLTIAFRQEMKIPIPFSLLGYHPGIIRSSEKVVFSELRSLSRAIDDGNIISPVYVFRLTEGYAAIDVDDWITFLFSSIIDDITVRVLAIFRFKDHWYCMLNGTGRRGQLIAGLLDFRTNRILFPLPAIMGKFAAKLLQEADSASEPSPVAAVPAVAPRSPEN
jgi:hypothetical protein